VVSNEIIVESPNLPDLARLPKSNVAGPPGTAGIGANQRNLPGIALHSQGYCLRAKLSYNGCRFCLKIEIPANRSATKGGKMRKVFSGVILCLACVFCLLAAIGSPAQTFTVLASFDSTNGANPQAALVQGTDGNF